VLRLHPSLRQCRRTDPERGSLLTRRWTAAARAEGRIGGRCKKLDIAKRREIARLYNINQATVSRIVAQHRMGSIRSPRYENRDEEQGMPISKKPRSKTAPKTSTKTSAAAALPDRRAMAPARSPAASTPEAR
jgi:hypothetical protein